MKTSAVLLLLLGFLTAGPAEARSLAPAEAREIARDAYVYGFPLVDSYRILHSYSVDRAHPEYKGPWNHLANVGRVFTPEDKAVQTPNSDTPYSMVAFDLRSEPLVFTVPAIEPERYFSIQFIDAYTANFDYVGTRSTGNGGGSFLLAGPGWKGKVPAGIRKVMRSETQLGIAIFRTQLLNPGDIGNVRRIQSAYRVEPLSAFLGKPAPKPVPVLQFPQPLGPEDQKKSLQFFALLDFVLDFCPVHPSEKQLRARFRRLGLGAPGAFDPATLAPELKEALAAGIGDAWKVLAEMNAGFASGKVTSGDIFGSREHLKNNYPYRFLAAVAGIWGNTAVEAMYPGYRVDSTGQSLNGAQARYTLRFPPGQLPPVRAFWSATLYELPASLLYANPLNRYLINSPMLPQLQRDADGGITLHVQHESPGKDRESNWVPAPRGPFWIALRLYWPEDAALSGRWKQPPLARVP